MGPHRSPLTHPVTWAVVAAVVVLVGWAVLRTMGKDAGASWSSVSLSGEADFHSLVVADQQMFGWDSGTGQLMVSADRATWETRSTLDLLSFVGGHWNLPTGGQWCVTADCHLNAKSDHLPLSRSRRAVDTGTLMTL